MKFETILKLALPFDYDYEHRFAEHGTIVLLLHHPDSKSQVLHYFPSVFDCRLVVQHVAFVLCNIG